MNRLMFSIIDMDLDTYGNFDLRSDVILGSRMLITSYRNMYKNRRVAEMLNHNGPPQIWGFPGIGPSNDRGDAKVCNHIGTATIVNPLESISRKMEG